MDENFITPLNLMAIQAALSAKWQEALDINNKIISLDPKNVDALNRAARCYFELGNLTEAKKLYEKSLSCDPYNQIAAKFLKRIATFKKGSTLLKPNYSSPQLFSSDLFIKEPGKTKLVNLIKVAEPQRLSLLSPGTEVNLIAKNHSVNVSSTSGQYLGALPDDVAHKLVKFIRGGNKYQAFVKSTKPNSVTLLIKEVSKAARFKNQPSFPELGPHITYPSDHILIHDTASEDTREDAQSEEDII